MRILFLFLLLVNLAFFAGHHFLAEADGAAAKIASLQISPGKIKPISAETVPAVAPVSSTNGARTAATPVPAACVEWGTFGGKDVARADTAFATLTLPASSTLRRITDVDGYWVHMPPLKNKGEVDRKVGELKALGIEEFYVVQDPGQWRNAVSLGHFRNEDAANVELERLRERGVRSATVTRREKFFRQLAYYVREPDAETVARLTELQRDFPATEIKAGSCPVGFPPKT